MPRSSYPTSLRFVKAYWVTFQVILSYVRLRFRTYFAGPDYYQSNVGAIHRRNAERIEQTILQLKGLFIKVGQLISIMTNFLPEEFRKPLQRLQDQVPARPIEEIRKRIEEELHGSPDTLFAYFCEQPLASASLGQVHRARLKDGTEVVVKVQHHDIDRIVQADLKTIWRILRVVRWFVPVQGMELMYRQIKEMVFAELDFELEVLFMRQIAANLADLPDVGVPAPLAEFCTKKVMTTTFVDGSKLTDHEKLEIWKLNRKVLAERLVRAYCKMIFVDGLYHADPHPGNLMITPHGEIVLIDFGAVAELSPSMKRGIPDFLEAVIKRDTPGIFRALRTMGFIAHGNEAERASERIIEYFHRKFQDEVKLDSFNLKDIKVDPQRSLENLVDLKRQEIGLRELTGAFQVPKDWVLLERTILLLAGVCTDLDPDMNPMVVIRPYLEEFVLGEHRDFTTLILNATKETALSALSVPDDLRRYLSKASRGELEIRVRNFPEAGQLIYTAAHQLIYALFSMFFGTAAIFFHLQAWFTLSRWASGFAAAFFVTMFFSFMRTRRLSRR
ncbi:MAG: AarF/ABC1/UbiB kinase family protein [Myxococcales bacterium]|nr:MAG: AarF/ABC1/UbiB kinase family protein [Myxococcales bacterium]